MNAVVNHLPIKDGADWRELAAKFTAFELATRQTHPDLMAPTLIRVSDNDAVLYIVYRDRQSLDELSKSVAAPWFAENVRPYLAGPVSRSVGEIIAGSGATC